MPTSKWLEELADMWDWMQEDESQALHEIVFNPTITRVAHWLHSGMGGYKTILIRLFGVYKKLK